MSAPVRILAARELAEIAFHQLGRLVLAFAIPMALAVAAAVVAGQHYQASASLLARMGQEYLYRGPIGDATPMAFEREQTLKSEITILTSRDLVEKTIQSIGVDHLYPGQPALLAVERFLSALDVQLLNKSNVIQVSFRHADPVVAAEAVNKLVDYYIDRRRDIYFDPRVDTLDGEVKRYRQRLSELEHQTEHFKRGNGIVSFVEQRDLLLRQRADLDARVKAAANTLAEIQRKLTEQRRNIDLAERVGRLAVLDAVEGDVLKLQADESAAMVAHTVQSQQLAELDGHLAALAQSEREMDRLRREVTIAADNYQTYARKLEEARILEIMDRRQMANMRLIQAATPPTRPVSFRPLILAAGVVVGLMSALAVLLLSEWRRDTVLTPEEVERVAGFPVMAEFPADAARK